MGQHKKGLSNAANPLGLYEIKLQAQQFPVRRGGLQSASPCASQELSCCCFSFSRTLFITRARRQHMEQMNAACTSHCVSKLLQFHTAGSQQRFFFFHLYSVHALPPWQHSGTTDFLTWQAIFEKSITSCSEDQCYFNIIYLDFFVHYFHESAVIVLHLFFSFFQGSSISFSMANFSFYKPTDLQVHLCVLFSADKMLFLVPENMGSNGETKQSIKQIFYLHFYTY